MICHCKVWNMDWKDGVEYGTGLSGQNMATDGQKIYIKKLKMAVFRHMEYMYPSHIVYLKMMCCMSSFMFEESCLSTWFWITLISSSENVNL